MQLWNDMRTDYLQLLDFVYGRIERQITLAHKNFVTLKAMHGAQVRDDMLAACIAAAKELKALVLLVKRAVSSRTLLHAPINCPFAEPQLYKFWVCLLMEKNLSSAAIVGMNIHLAMSAPATPMTPVETPAAPLVALSWWI